MTPYGKFYLRDRAVENIMPRAVADELASMFLQEFYELGSFHFVTAFRFRLYTKNVYETRDGSHEHDW